MYIMSYVVLNVVQQHKHQQKWKGAVNQNRIWKGKW
jgi:hypothetical protein